MIINFANLQLDRQKKCFNFNIMREFKVSNQKPAVVTTYDYYTPGNPFSILIPIRPLFG